VELQDMALAEVGQCDGLRFLSISNCPQLSTEGFRSVVDGCRGLRTVLCALHVLNKPRGLRQVLVDDALLGRAWEAWPQLSRFATTQQAFSLAGFANVAASLHNLSLEDCPVDDEVLRCIALRCPQLQRLVLRHTQRVRKDVEPQCLGFTSEGLRHFTGHRCLEELDLTYNWTLWEGLQSIVRSCKRLQRLYFGYRKPEPQALEELVQDNAALALHLQYHNYQP
jgi:hypothetical protein